MASQKFTIYIFPMQYKIWTDKFLAAATVHFPGAKCHYSQRFDL